MSDYRTSYTLHTIIYPVIIRFNSGIVFTIHPQCIVGLNNQEGVGMKGAVVKIIVVAVAALGAVGGCGSDCGFDLRAILNGPSPTQALSQWSCVGSRNGQSVPEFVIQFFGDGSGFNDATGPFTYKLTGCRSLSYESDTDEARITNIQGSVFSGILIFDQSSTVADQDGIQGACTPEFF